MIAKLPCVTNGNCLQYFRTFCPFRSASEPFLFLSLSLFVSWPFICVLSLLLSFVVYERETTVWSLHVRVCVSFFSSLRSFFLFTWCVNCALHCMRVIFVDFIRFFIRTSQKRRKTRKVRMLMSISRGESTLHRRFYGIKVSSDEKCVQINIICGEQW